MFTIKTLVELAFSLGLNVTFELVPENQAVWSYYNEEKNTIVNCTFIATEMGPASVCPMGDRDAVVYLIKP